MTWVEICELRKKRGRKQFLANSFLRGWKEKRRAISGEISIWKCEGICIYRWMFMWMNEWIGVRYDRRVRPVVNHSQPTTVMFSMSLYQILSIVSQSNFFFKKCGQVVQSRLPGNSTTKLIKIKSLALSSNPKIIFYIFPLHIQVCG